MRIHYSFDRHQMGSGGVGKILCTHWWTALSVQPTFRPKDLHADTQRTPGAGRSLGVQGILLVRETELHHRVPKEQRDEPGQEQPGETLPLSSTQSYILYILTPTLLCQVKAGFELDSVGVFCRKKSNPQKTKQTQILWNRLSDL